MNHGPVTPDELHDEAGHGRPERARDPGEKNEKDDEAGLLPRREAVGAENVHHQGTGGQRREERQAEKDRPTPDRGPPQAIASHG